jgi:hypothetical protein
MTITNSDRSRWAATALAAFRQETGSDREDSLGDLLCDLMDWADAHNFDFEAALFRARCHYREERTEAAAEPEPFA